MSLPGRPKGEYRSAKHVGCLMNPTLPPATPPLLQAQGLDMHFAITGGLLKRTVGRVDRKSVV